jgi:predicted phage-related endonuclease
MPSQIAEMERKMNSYTAVQKDSARRQFIGGSDARTIMGDDEAGLLRLWREKPREVEPEDLTEMIC